MNFLSCLWCTITESKLNFQIEQPRINEHPPPHLKPSSPFKKQFTNFVTANCSTDTDHTLVHATKAPNRRLTALAVYQSTFSIRALPILCVNTAQAITQAIIRTKGKTIIGEKFKLLQNGLLQLPAKILSLRSRASLSSLGPLPIRSTQPRQSFVGIKDLDTGLLRSRSTTSHQGTPSIN